MSPIIDLQRRLREVGRIRLGEQVPTSSGKMRPAKLSKFRFTSADETAIKAVSTFYGGEPRPWSGGAIGEQFELYADAKELDVLVPPVDLAWSQWMENWSGAVCRNRCDGQMDVQNNAPCVCDPDAPTCKPTSRLGVILTGVDGIGIWRMETHGWNSAQELHGSIEVLRVAQNRGAMVPARLILEQRQQKKLNAQTNKVETFLFAVPVLDLALSTAALTGGQVTVTPRLPSGVTPIGQPRAEALSVAEQVKAIDVPVERPKRANAAATLPPTGIKPRAATVATPPPIVEEIPKAVLAKTPASDKTPGGASKASVRRLFAILNGRDDIGKDDDARHMWALTTLGWGTDAPISFNDLSQKDITKLNDAASSMTQPSADIQYEPGHEPF